MLFYNCYSTTMSLDNMFVSMMEAKVKVKMISFYYF